MSNSFFRFKEFSIQQDRCAMKVSTDACLQGALTPVNPTMVRVLDIGTGTGLLSLMIAQRQPHAVIDALELDGEAARQAVENIAASPFAGRIRVMNCDALTWGAGHHYDLIICNPPFFANSLKGPVATRNAARHISGLSAKNLINIFAEYLPACGVASVMWPPAGHEVFAQEALAAGLHLHQAFEVGDKLQSRITRIVSIWGKEQIGLSKSIRFVIKEEDGSYTAEAALALNPFYLHI